MPIQWSETKKAEIQVSNLSKGINIAVDLASKMAFKWRMGSYYTKQRIQSLLFPSGIIYSKKNDGCRTERINLCFCILLIYSRLSPTKNEEYQN